MGDENSNQPRTLGDYSRPSHEGYRNAIELPEGAKDLLRKVPHHGLDLWLQVQIFYDHVNYTTQMAIDYAAGGRLRKSRPEEAWETIEELESMKRRVESLMRSEVLLYYEGGFTSPKRPYQEEFEG
ncbi:hypothetical protein Tco_1475156, partial [Tanacetum coccineum]